MSSQSSQMSLNAERQNIVDDILKLYQLEPTHERFRHYAADAVFEDPIAHAVGIGSVKAQFFGMPKVFNKSVTENYSITKNEPDEINIDLNQRYTFAIINKEKLLNSLVVLKFNDEGKIILHQDLWDKKPLNKEGILGSFGDMVRKVSAKVLKWTISIPKEGEEKK
ncbi:uncharacterized protein VTP21DRAFT_10320 [Calcarisporiella thermophila]|uniref:uncharacterized protein n=1 Tax=Calcarisporiella thermophila TaxID=911321 RepID=UPI003744347D